MLRSNLFFALMMSAGVILPSEAPRAALPSAAQADGPKVVEVFHNSGTGKCRTTFEDNSYCDQRRAGCKECEEKAKKD